MKTLLADSTRYIDLFISLKEAVVQSAIGVDLAFQDIILDAPFLEVENLLSERLNARLHLAFLRKRRFVSRFEGVANCADLSANLPIDLFDLVDDLNHRRVAWLEVLQLFLVLGL
jgi:hypothetical protein